MNQFLSISMGGAQCTSSGDMLYKACSQIRIFLKRPPSPEKRGDCIYKGSIMHLFFGGSVFGGSVACCWLGLLLASVGRP